MVTPTAHAILGPSSAHRWLVCTPSARFEEQIPPETSEYAEEGTVAHELAALLLQKETGQIVDKDTTKWNKALYDVKDNAFYCKEMRECVNEYVDFCLSIEGIALVEHRFTLEPFVPLGFGTSDCTVINCQTKRLTVVDLKYGKGVRVQAVGNRQGMLYALGALRDLDPEGVIETVEICIYQPRAGGLSRWEITVDELLDWANNEVASKAKLAIAGQGEFKAGEHCKFCNAKTVCRAYYKLFEGVLNLRKKDPRELTDEEIAAILLQAKPIETWLKSVQSDALKAAKDGILLPGFKLVPGRGSRVYKSEDVVIETLIAEGYTQDKIFNSKIRSITDLEKELGKKRFNELFADNITNKEGAPTLVPDEDARSEFSNPNNDFDDGFTE